VGSARYEATATPLEGKERDQFWAEAVARWPHLAEYQAKAGRV
jgi:hypothetical protein